MPNGKAGDHPLTDILHYGHSEFGEPVDGLVKELSKLPGFPSVASEIGEILWRSSPMGRPAPERQTLIDEAAFRIREIKQKLESSI